MSILYSEKPSLILMDIEGLSFEQEYDLHEYLRMHPEFGCIRQPNGGSGHFAGLFTKVGSRMLRKWLKQNGAIEKGAGSE